jgi:hypothetical protein
VQFDGDAVLLGTPDGHYDIQITGTASDLAFFLWLLLVQNKPGLRVKDDIGASGLQAASGRQAERESEKSEEKTARCSHGR